MAITKPATFTTAILVERDGSPFAVPAADPVAAGVVTPPAPLMLMLLDESGAPVDLATLFSGGAGGAVASVNGHTGVVVLVKADVGLGSVDNTADADKPVSSAQQTALDLKANLASPTFTGSVTLPAATVSNAMLAAMPQATIKGRAAASGSGAPIDLSAAQATAILDSLVGDSGAGGTKGLVPAPGAGDAAAGKYLKASGVWDTPAGSGSGDVVGPASVTDDLPAVFDGTTGKLIKAKAYAAFKTLLALVKGDVGLSSVDNTADTAKPVSTAQQTALDLKANLASPTFTGTPAGPTASPGTNTTQFSTTAFVKAAIDVVLGGVSSAFDTLAEIVAGYAALAGAVFTGAIQVTTVEVGHATDTTLSRSAAGVIAVEGVVIPSISSTNTLTNKRISKRIGSATSSATPTINTDNVDIYQLTAQAADITSFTTNLSGTPVEGDRLIIEITGTAARAIAWGTSFEASTVALPTTTVTTAKLSVGFIYNAVTSKWRCVAVA